MPLDLAKWSVTKVPVMAATAGDLATGPWAHCAWLTWP
jgi:hypothetical protein